MGKDYNARRQIAKRGGGDSRGEATALRTVRRGKCAECAEKTTGEGARPVPRLRMAQLSVGWLRPLAILFVEVAMFVVGAGELALDDEVAHLRLELEWISVGHDDVGEFSRLEGAELIGQAENLRGVQHHRFQRLVMRQAVGHRGTGVLRQAARESCAETGKREWNSGGE